MKTRLPQLSHSCMAEMNIFWKLAKIFGREKMAKRKFGQEKIAQETIGQEIIVLNVRNVIYVLIANIFSTVTCGFWSFFTKVSGCWQTEVRYEKYPKNFVGFAADKMTTVLVFFSPRHTVKGEGTPSKGAKGWTAQGAEEPIERKCTDTPWQSHEKEAIRQPFLARE